MSYPTTLPATFHAGDTVQWEKTLSDYPPSDGWTLKYAFVSSDQRILATGTSDDDVHVMELSYSDTNSMTPGVFSYQGYVEDASGERHTVDTGTLEVFANFADQSTGYDARDHVQKVIDAIEAVIEGRASKAQASRKIGDRELQYIPLDELLDIRERYKTELYENEQERKRLEGEMVDKNIGFMFTR